MPGAEVRRPDLDLHGAGEDTGVSQPTGQVVRQIEQQGAERVAVADVLAEGRLRADRLRLAVGNDGTVVLAVCELPDVPAQLPEVVGQYLLGQRGQLADGADPEGVQPLLGLRAHAPDATDR